MNTGNTYNTPVHSMISRVPSLMSMKVESHIPPQQPIKHRPNRIGRMLLLGFLTVSYTHLRAHETRRHL
eukprot:4922938-Prorocentrum_lima.AAC.1